MPVGHICKFDLEKTFSLDFGVKCNFSKTRIELVMLKILATTEKQKNKIKRTRLQSRESSQKIAAGNCYSQFLIYHSNESRAVLFLAEDGK